MKPLFLTSLAPAPKRQVDGREVGMAHQSACYRSIVRELGPCLSLHYGGEADTIHALFDDADVLTVQAATDRPDRRPLMRLADMQTAVATRNATHIGLINADIYAPPQAARLLAPLIGSPQAALFVCRSECTHLAGPTGPAYLHGFDLAVLPKSFFQNLDLQDFAMGVPWWDYALPLAAALGGRSVIINVTSGLRHISHPPSWSSQEWERGLLSLLTLLDSPDTPSAAEFAPDWRRLLQEELIASGKGHQHKPLLHWGGALFGRLCRERIFAAACVV